MRKRLAADGRNSSNPASHPQPTSLRPAPIGFTRSSTTASGSWPVAIPSASWSGARYPLVVEAVKHLKVRSCLIDGEVVCCDEQGMTSFQLLRHRRNEPQAFLYAFDLLELNGTDLRREPIEVRTRRRWRASAQEPQRGAPELPPGPPDRASRSTVRGRAPDEMLGLALRRLAEALPHPVPYLWNAARYPARCAGNACLPLRVLARRRMIQCRATTSQ